MVVTDIRAGLRRGFIATALFSGGVTVLQLTLSLYMAQVYDRVLGSRSVDTLVYLTLAALMALAAQGGLEAVRSRLLAGVGAWLERRTGALALCHGMAGAGAEPLRDLREVRGVLGSGILVLFDLPWAPLFLLLAWALHPLLGLVTTLGVVVLAGLAVLTGRKAPGAQARKAEREALRLAETACRNAHVVRAMGMAGAVTARWEAVSREADVAAPAVLMGLSRFVRPAVQVLVLAVGAHLVLNQELTPGGMFASSLILGRALAPVDQLIANWQRLAGARAAWKRLAEGIAAVSVAPAGLPLPAPTGRLEVDEVAFAHALRGVSFSLEAGESVVVAGPSAAGKSTLGRLLVGLHRPSSGHVRLDGAELSDWDRDQVGRHLGYLPQDAELFSGTVAENIARLGDPDPAMVVAAARMADCHDMILRLPQGYGTQIGDGGARLSGGQRQRIGLARALYGRPRLVVLDEPDAHLDRDGQAALIHALRQLKQDGATVVVVTHRPGLAAHVDRLLVLREGKVTRFDPVSGRREEAA